MYIGSLLLLYGDQSERISCLPFSLCFSLAPLLTSPFPLSFYISLLSSQLQISSDPHRRCHHCHQGMCKGNLIGGRTRLGGRCWGVTGDMCPPKFKKKKPLQSLTAACAFMIAIKQQPSQLLLSSHQLGSKLKTIG